MAMDIWKIAFFAIAFQFMLGCIVYVNTLDYSSNLTEVEYSTAWSGLNGSIMNTSSYYGTTDGNAATGVCLPGDTECTGDIGSGSNEETYMYADPLASVNRAGRSLSRVNSIVTYTMFAPVYAQERINKIDSQPLVLLFSIILWSYYIMLALIIAKFVLNSRGAA